MKNYICIGDKKIPISCETAENLKKEFAKEEGPEIRYGDYGEGFTIITHHGGTLRAEIDETHDIRFTLPVTHQATANIKESQDFHQKLGQLISTALRRKAKDC